MKMKTIHIKNFSKLSGIDSSTLRYWDAIGVFSPVERHPETNYRYYTSRQLLTLNCIRILSKLKTPLKTIADLKNERNPDSMLKLLDELEKQMLTEMDYIRLRYSIIQARRRQINKGLRVDENTIQVMSKDERSVMVWPKNEYNDGDSFIEPLAAKVAVASQHSINLSFPVGGLYASMDSFSRAPNRPCHFYSMDPYGTKKVKAGNYLTGFCRGNYGEVGDLPDRLNAYARDNSLIFTGPVYIEYLFDELCTPNPNQYLAQCIVAVTK